MSLRAGRSLGRQALSNLVWKFGAEGLSRGLALVLVLLLTRLLGPEAFGAYSLPLAQAATLVLLLDWGINALIVRELAPHAEATAPPSAHADADLRALLWLKIASSALYLVVLLGGVLWLPEGLRLGAAGLIWLAQSWLDTGVAWLNARQAFRHELGLRTLFKLLTTLPLIALLLWRPLPDLIDALLWTGAGTHLLALGAVALLGLRRSQRLGQTLLPERDRLLRLAQQAWHFGLANVFWLLYLKADLLMLGALRSEAELGWYQGALRLYELQGLAGYLISMALYPLLAREVGHAERFAPLVKRALMATAGAGLLCGAGGVLLGPWLAPALLGTSFARSGQLLAILSLGMPAVFVNLLGFNLLGVWGRQRALAWATGACLAFNLLLNAAWIPRWGGLGAAWSTVLADGLLCVIWLFLTRRALKDLWVPSPGR
ncbi:MAG: oligosaccharide flippase family protein [Candidatus Sericytochromatia bacterium]